MVRCYHPQGGLSFANIEMKSQSLIQKPAERAWRAWIDLWMTLAKSQELSKEVGSARRENDGSRVRPELSLANSGAPFLAPGFDYTSDTLFLYFLTSV